MNKAVNEGTPGEIWSGTWVADRLGVELVGDSGLTDLLGLALRRNPKRAHLLVSNVLGKHVPQSPSVVYGHGFSLGRRVRELLGDDEAARAVVLGYAETATGLGHSVADGVGLAPYLHSTRRPVPGVTPRAASRNPTPTPRPTCCSRRTRTCWRARVPWSWSTTSSPRATRS